MDGLIGFKVNGLIKTDVLTSVRLFFKMPVFMYPFTLIPKNLLIHMSVNPYVFINSFTISANKSFYEGETTIYPGIIHLSVLSSILLTI